MNRLNEAIRVAVAAHDGQRDKAGLPYILHPMRVMFAVIEELKKQPVRGYLDEDVIIAAILHDVVEDTPVTLTEIREKFGIMVVIIVDRLTRRKGKETYKEFILRAKQNPAARLIKIADLLDNLGRIQNLPESERSIEKRYHAALDVLNDPDEPSWEQASFHAVYLPSPLLTVLDGDGNEQKHAITCTILEGKCSCGGALQGSIT